MFTFSPFNWTKRIPKKKKKKKKKVYYFDCNTTQDGNVTTPTLVYLSLFSSLSNVIQRKVVFVSLLCSFQRFRAPKSFLSFSRLVVFFFLLPTKKIKEKKKRKIMRNKIKNKKKGGKSLFFSSINREGEKERGKEGRDN